MPILACIPGMVLLGLLSGCQIFDATLMPSRITDREDISDSRLPRFTPLWDQLSSDHWEEAVLLPDPHKGPQVFESWSNESHLLWRYRENHYQESSTTEKHFRELQSIAQRDDLPGWNACILIARHAPHQCDSLIEERLKYLMSSQARYEATSFEAESQVSPEITPMSLQAKIANHLPLRSSKQEGDTSEALKQDWKSVSPALRSAAAEAYCLILSTKSGSAEERYQYPGQYLNQTDVPESVRWTLWKSIAKEIPPRHIPGIDPAQTETPQSPEDQIAKLDSCILYALHQTVSEMSSSLTEYSAGIDELDPHQLWPQTIWKLRWDESPDIVARFSLWLALIKHPLAEKYHQTFLTHSDQKLRHALYRNLGILKTSGAYQLLKDQIERLEGPHRAIAVTALGAWGDDEVLRYRNDSNLEVQLAVVNHLGQHASLSNARTMHSMLLESDREISQQIITAISSWDRDLAIPILAAGYREGLIETRTACRQQIEERLNMIMTGMGETSSDRQAILEKLSQKYRFPLHLVASAEESLDQDSLSIAEQSQYEQVKAEIEEFLQVGVHTEIENEQFWTSLTEHADVIHHILDDLERPQVKQVLKLAPPFISSEIKAVQGLSAHQVHQRRDSAKDLRTLAQAGTLSAWMLTEMAEVISQEQDQQVCHFLMQAIDHDVTEESRLVAEGALTHHWPDVRVMGCQYVQKHRLPQLASFLLSLMQERHPSVQRAAILAAGACRNPLVIDGYGNQSGGLRSLLGTTSGETELLVIESLARLGDQQGESELLKLCHSPDSQLRLKAVSMIGRTENDQLVEPLIQLIWTERHGEIRRAAAISLKQAVPDYLKPTALQESMTTDQQLEIWTKWSLKNQSLSAAE